MAIVLFWGIVVYYICVGEGQGVKRSASSRSFGGRIAIGSC